MSDPRSLTDADLAEIGKRQGEEPAAPPVEGVRPSPQGLTLTTDSSLSRVPVQVTAVIGRSVLQVSELLKLGRGAIIELDSKVGSAIDIYVNNRRIARGELIVNDDRLSVSMTEVLKVQDS